ncbi:glucose-6-phosphate isomerase [Actinomycetospora cinnamomea]|uniref:Glucose-6-phosphate isomerase n=1 Tax=Actinomycetospora cinnamomea TaxID=663609 RepID=A0A2U1FHW3_9PSEU|nr:glucose-6-phosphate isomerase [Actinomycetospora cinnamomea]PVZ11757.1 glucose-6-phosphate isomerase [Actinomycetospora cinnamomea]
MTTPRVEITDEGLAEAAASLVEKLVGDAAASKLAGQDPTLWGPDAEPEASKRLSWTLLHNTSRPLVAELDALRRELHEDGVDRVVLAGMGGSSLAPEVICATRSGAEIGGAYPLVVLDTTDPGQVSDALAGDLSRTVLVVSSKSGGTVETDSQRRIFAQVFEANGIDAASRMVAVTDPGTSLGDLARDQGFRRLVEADPGVGGRYSALTAFGLVPSALTGVDVGALLDEAAEAAPALARDAADNPAVVLAAAMAAAHAAGAEKVVLADTGSGLVGFGNWAEQLIAESTGKQGTGLLPVVVEGPEAPGFADAGPDATPIAIGPAAGGARVSVTGSLGGQFLLWETAVALAGRLLGINPFDQPDVESAKQATRDLLAAAGSGDGAGTHDDAPVLTDGPVEVRVAGSAEQAGWLGSPATLAAAIQALVDATPEAGYVAIQAYLDRLDDASFATLRPELAKATGLQVTFGWGPRFLHSTGQYHKGGHQNGTFLQVTGSVADDLAIPGQPFSFGTLEHAQARGDAGVLAAPKNGRPQGDVTARPVLRLHLADRAAGLVAVANAVREVSR